MAKGNSAKSKGQKKEDLERKRDERARRRVVKKEREIKEYLENDENFVSFKNQLEAIGLKIKDILGDGNCLFRALGDQLNGDHTAHAYHRRNTIQYMKEHREDFEPFMEDGISFEKHLKELSKLGTYGGNDSIVAFARNNGLDVVIHQLNNPRWVIHGSEYSKTPEIIELHLAYHNGEHYSSVRKLSDPGDGPAWQYDRKNIAQPMQNKETAAKSNNKSKKKKEAKKKDKAPQQQGATASSPAENCEGLEQIIINATGCKDLKLIAETLEENNFDVDASIGYVLQLMSVMEDQDYTHSSNTSLNSSTNVGTTEVEEHHSSLSEIDTDTVKNVENITDNNDSIVSTEPICNGDEKDTNALNEFVDNLRDNLTVVEADSEKSRNKMVKQGARPKENTKKNSSKAAPHLSNRQRKELAKQEKKKRREERRKEDEHTEDGSSFNIKDNGSSNSLVADLGAVCI